MKETNIMNKYNLLKLIIPTVFISLTAFKEADEKVKYTVYHNSQKVGTVTTNKTVTNNQTTYSLYSEVNIDMIIDIKIIEQITDVFESERLHTSTHSRKINSVEKANNKATWNGSMYLISKNGKQEKTIKDKINATVMSLYYKEPADQSKIYSQNSQQICTVKKQPDHAYDLQLPEGKTTRYKYIGGKLFSVESNTTWGKVTFYRTN